MGTMIDAKTAVRLGATSLCRYGRLFFEKTLRQKSPQFHEIIGKALYNPQFRQVAIEVFRDGAKTTLLRLFASQRLAYRISKTILFISASQGHSILSLRWLKRQILHNKKWSETFGLCPGAKWTDEMIEVSSTIDNSVATIMALGITGQLRGFNVDDYRPDLIICDDTSTDEMVASLEQRKKYDELFFGALVNSLAPASESPDSKIVLLDTPKSRFDLIESCISSPQWHGLCFGVFDQEGNSRWEERYPRADLLKAKEDYFRSGRGPIWMREKECRIVSSETSSFLIENLQYWELLPEAMSYVIAIDPASSDSKSADDNVVVVLGFQGGDVYVIDYVAEIGQTPEMVSQAVIEYVRRYKPLGIVVEAIGYQRTLAWYLEAEMKRHRVYPPVYQVQDRRRKSNRIIQALGSVSGYGRLFVRPTSQKFIEQYTTYSPLSTDHDDVLDAIAMGITWATSRQIFEDSDEDVLSNMAINDEADYAPISRCFAP